MSPDFISQLQSIPMLLLLVAGATAGIILIVMAVFAYLQARARSNWYISRRNEEHRQRGPK